MDSNVVLGKPDLSHFEEAGKRHTYLDERSQPRSRRWFLQGEAAPLHQGVVDPCDFPKCGKLDVVIFVSGDLRSR